jgi:hypothetical protein
MKKITDAQRKRLEDYAPSDIYTHADGSRVVIMWTREAVEIHRIMSDGSVWTSTRAFDEDGQWEFDVMHTEEPPAEIPVFKGTRAALDSLGKRA